MRGGVRGHLCVPAGVPLRQPPAPLRWIQSAFLLEVADDPRRRVGRIALGLEPPHDLSCRQLPRRRRNTRPLRRGRAAPGLRHQQQQQRREQEAPNEQHREQQRVPQPLVLPGASHPAPPRSTQSQPPAPRPPSEAQRHQLAGAFWIVWRTACSGLSSFAPTRLTIARRSRLGHRRCPRPVGETARSGGDAAHHSHQAAVRQAAGS